VAGVAIAHSHSFPAAQPSVRHFNIIMKKLSLLLAVLYSTSLHAGNSKIILDLTSSGGHTVIVGEYSVKGKKTTVVSLSFENKVCIKDILSFNGPNEKLNLNWDSDALLKIKVPKKVELKTEFSDDFLKCGFQKVGIEVEVNNNA